MTYRRRIILAALVVAFVSAAFMSIGFLLPPGTSTEVIEVARDAITPAHEESLNKAPLLSMEVMAARAQVESESPREPTPEPLIEDLLADSGEDPGAVYYMSRVREALREGNPTFARELLRQMREEHSSSVLVEEAEALCLAGGR